MKDMSDNSIDLIWFSPPYWDLHHYSNSDKEIGHNQSLNEFIESLTSIAYQGRRILKETGNLVINIMDLVRGNRPVLLSNMCIEKFDTNLVERIVWFIRNKMPVASDKRFVNKMEWILHFAKTPDYYFNKDEVRLPHSQYAEKDNRKWKYNDRGKCPGNVWNIKADRTSGKNKFHIAGFPIELCKRVINCWCPVNGTVLDPFAGSGTTCVAAKQLDRDYIGIDISQKYCQIAKKRLGQEYLF